MASTYFQFYVNILHLGEKKSPTCTNFKGKGGENVFLMSEIRHLSSSTQLII